MIKNCNNLKEAAMSQVQILSVLLSTTPFV